MAERLIAELDKNSRETLRISRTVYEGHELVDVRVYAKPLTDGDEARPTKKGVSIKPGMVDDVVAALLAAKG